MIPYKEILKNNHKSLAFINFPNNQYRANLYSKSSLKSRRDLFLHIITPSGVFTFMDVVLQDRITFRRRDFLLQRPCNFFIPRIMKALHSSLIVETSKTSFRFIFG